MRIRSAFARLAIAALALVALALPLAGCSSSNDQSGSSAPTEQVSLDEIPTYSGNAVAVVDDNAPDFTAEELEVNAGLEEYGQLDSLGRCTYAFSCVGTETMPTESRGSISSVHPTGWVQAEYSFVDQGMLYNRCHLIAHELTGEDANENNLITGTRYMNTEGMLPYENEVADYVEDSGNHVAYRVTPIFDGDDLVASGVQMEAKSLEDDGAGICFNIYCYNVQPGVVIDYATGESREASGSSSTYKGSSSSTSSSTTYSGAKSSTTTSSTSSSSSSASGTYVLNTSSKKFHKPSCSGVKTMSSANKKTYTGSRSSLIDQGYEPCGTCNP